MENLKELLKELATCEIANEQRTYNGVTMSQSEWFYGEKLDRLYNAAATEYVTEAVNVDALRTHITRIAEAQESFDIPNRETVERLRLDYETLRTPSLKADYEFCWFVRRCYERQLYYMGELLSLVGIQQQAESNGSDVSAEAVKSYDEQVEPQRLEVIKGMRKLAEHMGISTGQQQAESNGSDVSVETVKSYDEQVEPPRLGVIKGVRKLAKYMGISTGKAQGILRSGRLNKGIAYKIGGEWHIDLEKFECARRDDPNLLSGIPAYRGTKTNYNC